MWKVTEDMVKIIINKYESWVPNVKISKELWICTWTTLFHLRKNWVKTRWKAYKYPSQWWWNRGFNILNEYQKNDICKMWSNWEKIHIISKKYSISDNRIRNIIKKNWLELRWYSSNKSRFTWLQKAVMLQYRKEWKTLKYIAWKFWCSMELVRLITLSLIKNNG